MTRHLLLTIACAIATTAQAGDDAKKQTIAYVQKLQTATGGFTTEPNTRVPTLGATSAAARSLHYLGSDVPNVAECRKFVDSCYHADSGGFSDVPGGKPSVISTAIGLMAVTELKMPTDKYAASATKYMSDNAKGFDVIRIAAAGLERLNARSAKDAEWIDEVLKLQNQDGSYGKGAGMARDTGGCVVTLLRLGVKFPRPEPILKILNEGQRQDGGWGKAESATASDLESTYRVMRCYMMLKARPKNVDGLRAFIAKCRNADGGYGVAPGQASNVNATYFAAIVTMWMKDY